MDDERKWIFAMGKEIKFSVYTVEYVTGKTEDQIRGYFNNKGETTKGGLDLVQIVNFLENNKFRDKRRREINKSECDTLRKLLCACGYEFPNGNVE